MTREDLERYNPELCGVIDGIDVPDVDQKPQEITDLLDLVADS